MHLSDLSPPEVFRTEEEVRDKILHACRRHSDLAKAEIIGESEEGRPILGVELGRGDRAVSLIAGNHSDEPVGPETLRTLILESLAHRSELEDLFETFRFFIAPHTNPDGEAKNQAWIRKWPDVSAYIVQAFREPPGRDMEFGFPNLRLENRSVSEFLRRGRSYALHASLHGMGFSDGALLLIERHWGFRAAALRERFIAGAKREGLALHDHNRQGEKGFFYLGPGFNTTPEGEAMRAFFLAQGDEETAGNFLDSSMEFIRSLGGDPLCLVTELPLFVLSSYPLTPTLSPVGEREASATGLEAYLQFREALPAFRAKLERGEEIQEELAAFALRPLSLQTAVKLQLEVLEAGLDAVAP